MDDTLYLSLQRRAQGANLSLSDFVRSVLAQAADPRGRYIYSSQDELLGIVIQILTLVATSIGERSPQLLERGMQDAKAVLRERGLLDPEQDR
ncbi:CopG family transcriptional regulator [Novosphingobium mangrovi (ex Huang et al. 2023)]|uniref:CopG family transcriptional regulator n=1 Tax=Novosphingobium mangrovi (ex Huang et al. 2023) TaxID=2976432 RepID=A0ABT2I5L7_9SPHN|nr:CopG family transcriptional regulator [Novosphingobium mangrovi (ex Huang et al. 2023)]MCT2400099.1 CopG family transcriptional regulator [Novosphingobium mangrovi (ex Huang et al. 2023)]